MKNELFLLAILNLITIAVVGNYASAQEGPGDGPGGPGNETISLGANPIKGADCMQESCSGVVVSTGSGANLDYGCIYNSATNTCSGTCYKCDGTNPNQRTWICVNVTDLTIECDPDSNSSSFSCSTKVDDKAIAHPCTAAGNDARSCCDLINANTPEVLGRSCNSVTCIDI